MADVVVDRPAGRVRRLSAALYRHPRLKLGLMLGGPLAWMLVVYLGALALLFANAFWRVDVFTCRVVREWGLQNFKILLDNPVYATITWRTVYIAAGVTVADLVLGFPLAYYAARIASPRVRSALLVAVVLPLWSSYLIRAFAWSTITATRGLLD